jgi:centrosomal protein CEP76
MFREIWWSLHTFLSKSKGDVEDHSILLCSLLLGFKMDAYVCVGTDAKGSKLWVMTRGSGGVTFWNSSAGTRHPHQSDTHQFKTIGCIFNHDSFFANIQRTDSISDCDFNIENENLWKGMSRMKLSLVKRVNEISLCPNTLNKNSLESTTEGKLKKLIEEYRKDLSVSVSIITNIFS